MSPQPTPQAPSAAPPATESSGDDLSRRSQWSNWTVLAMIILCFFVIVRFKPFRAGTPLHGRPSAKRLDRLQLQPLTGASKSVSLGDLTGHVVLLCLWSPWDAESRNGLAYLADVEHQFRRAPAFKFLAVSCGRGAKEDMGLLDYETRAFLKQANIDFPTYADPGGITRGAVDKAVGMGSYPTLVLIDRRGRIRQRWNRFTPEATQEIEQRIARLLDES